jgi:hypothetical protein
VRRFALALSLAALTAALLFWSRPKAQPPDDRAVRPWSLKRGSQGFTFTWDRRAPELRDAERLELVLHTAGSITAEPLERTAGSIVVPEMPQAVALRVDGRSFPLHGAIPAAPKPSSEPLQPAAESRPRTSTLRVPMLLSNRQQRVVSTASVVLPRVPGYVHRSHEVDVYVKVAPSGKVASAAANYGTDPLRRRLGAVASDAVAKWQFSPVAVNSYRDARIRIIFSPRGVTARPLA